ncbi:M-protein, striated muscle [Anabarilius grahami]|uniref:M-protein, striated muscle n=1 Tax=Anabarilius grahami TaxID=495550 RepID=A0A3N0XPD0_ANAGA|nr:M-protein, striated muscle [Anabarilius grahami]
MNYLPSVDRGRVVGGLPDVVTIMEKKSLSLTCTVWGDPSPEVTWFKNEQEVVSDDRYKITFEGGKFSSLTIKSVYVEDSGKYSINVRNKYGGEFVEITVSVYKQGEEIPEPKLGQMSKPVATPKPATPAPQSMKTPTPSMKSPTPTAPPSVKSPTPTPPPSVKSPTPTPPPSVKSPTPTPAPKSPTPPRSMRSPTPPRSMRSPTPTKKGNAFPYQQVAVAEQPIRMIRWADGPTPIRIGRNKADEDQLQPTLWKTLTKLSRPTKNNCSTADRQLGVFLP